MVQGFGYKAHTQCFTNIQYNPFYVGIVCGISLPLPKPLLPPTETIERRGEYKFVLETISSIYLPFKFTA